MNDNPSPILLNGLQIAQYSIIYRLSDKVELVNNEKLQSKTGVSANRFCSLDQQRNLIFVDMLFPNILADAALECYLGKICNFEEYIQLPKSFCITDSISDAIYFNNKIREFIALLLFSNIQQETLCSGTFYFERTFQYRNNLGEIQSYTSNDKNDLVELLLSKIKLKVDSKVCWCENNEFCITLDISI